MKKRFTFLIAALMLLTTIILPGKAVGQTTVTYTQVTSADELSNGDEVLVVSTFSSKSIAMLSTVSSTNKKYLTVDEVTINTNNNISTITLSNTSTITVWTIVKSVDNNVSYYSFKSGNNYVNSNSNSDNTANLTTTLGNSSKNTIEDVSNGLFQFKNVANTSKYLKGGNNGDRFAYYASNAGNSAWIKIFKKNSYTITPATNNEDYGTVSLSGNVITGAPAANCRYASPAYTVDPANSATVAQDNENINKFTVTPTANTTVTINFEAIPTHKVSVTPPSGGTITVKNGNDVIASGSDVYEGTTITIIAAAAANKQFSSWSVTGATPVSTTDATTTFVMETENVTIAAAFNDATTYPIHWSVNGSVVQTDNVAESAAITFPSSINGVPTGLEFKGWVAELIDGAQSTAPTYVTEATATEETTYYAVMAVKDESKPSLTKLGSTSTFAKDDNIVIVAKGTSYALYQETKNTSYVANFTFVDNATTISSDSKNYLTLTSSDNKWKLGDATNGYLYNSSNELYVGNTQTEWTISWNSTENAFTLYSSRYLTCRTDLSGDNQNLYRCASGPSTGIAYFDIYKLVSSSITYNDYCTSVTTNTFTTAGDWNDENNWSLGVVPSFAYNATINAACTIPSDCSAQINTITYGEGGSITIEDGGQLICNNSVYATVQKSIGAWDATSQKGWYTLSTPIGNATFSGDNPNVTNVVYTNISSQNEYNVYYYDETNHEWVNNLHGTGFKKFENGHGYIYRRGAAATLEFKGNVNVNAVVCNLSYECDDNEDLKGFNLLGNPFTHDITWDNFSDIDNVEDAGYYLLDETDSYDRGKWSASASKTAKIAPMQAFFVQANGENPTLTINNAAPAPAKKSREYSDNIMFSVKNSKHSDEAYVFFKEGHGLNKIEHRNADIPMLYIVNNGEDFAIADMNVDTKVINLGFQAKTIGQYKLSYKAEGDYSYMHLIDRLTGEDVDLLLEGEYSFMAAPSDNDNRFIIRLEDAANAGAFEDQSFVFQNGNDIIVNGNGELQVFDVMGRMIATQHVEGVQTIEKPSTTGVYMFKLNGNVQKVMVR